MPCHPFNQSTSTPVQFRSRHFLCLTRRLGGVALTRRVCGKRERSTPTSEFCGRRRPGGRYRHSSPPPQLRPGRNGGATFDRKGNMIVMGNRPVARTPRIGPQSMPSRSRMSGAWADGRRVERCCADPPRHSLRGGSFAARPRGLSARLAWQRACVSALADATANQEGEAPLTFDGGGALRYAGRDRGLRTRRLTCHEHGD